ncbi:hypothetical protein Q7P37_005867 [Cladosporium fusiforme]
MAGGFSFPPPPPPPPKPAAPSQQQEFEYSHQSGRGGRGRGGFESRGRGAGRGRGGGRGNPNFEPTGNNQHSNFNQGPGYSQPGGSQEHRSQWQNANQSASPSTNAQPPPGSYVNPNFTGQRQNAGGNAAYQPKPGYGVGGSGAQTSHTTSSNFTSNQAIQHDGPGRTQAGHKRKLDALRGSQQPREKKQGPQAAPSVPSFGAPILPSAPPTTSARPSANVQAGNRPKAGTKALGLTPQDGALPTYPSESEDEDVDEEAQFAELGTKLTFEHNGEVMTLNNEADLAAWKEERRKQFPTTNRVSEKESQRLNVGEERKRLLAAVARLHQAPRNRHTESKTKLLREPAKKPQEDLQGDSKMVDQPEQSSDGVIAPAMPRIEEVQETAAIVDEMSNESDTKDVLQQDTDAGAGADIPGGEDSNTMQEAEPPKCLPGIDMGETDDESIVEAADAGQPAEEEVESSSHSDSDDDGPPEEASSKPRPSAASDAQRPVCRYFAASGRCRDGDTCRFRHELSNKAPSARPFQLQQDKPAFDRFAPKLDPKPNDRKSIFERLMEQEQQGDDRLALQVIKALGQAGLFAQSTESETAEVGN